MRAQQCKRGPLMALSQVALVLYQANFESCDHGFVFMLVRPHSRGPLTSVSQLGMAQ